MTKQQIVEDLLKAIIRFGSRITSDKYILLILNTIIRDLRKDNTVFKYLDVRTTSYSSSGQVVNVDHEINSVNNESLGKSLSVLIHRIITPTGMRGKESFNTILEYEMGTELVKSLKRLGVRIN